MSIHVWIEQFRALHARARKETLQGEERQRYLASREQFARAMTAAQGMSLLPGQSLRRTFRIAHSLPVELKLASGTLQAVTADVSVGGFSALMHKPPPETEEPGFTLRLPGNLEPVTGRARVAATQRKLNAHRVSFAILGLSEKEQERLEMVVFDLALERLK